MRTFGEMREAVTQNLEAEGVNNVGAERVRYLLNSAKNSLVTMRDRYDRNWLTVRADLAVTKEDKSITLPDGSGTEAAFRRLLGVEWVEDESNINVYEYGDPGEKDTDEAGFYLIREGRQLYFDDKNGAPQDMTLRVRYTALVPDILETDASAVFAGLDAEWSDAAVVYATRMGIPAGNAAAIRKWENELSLRLANLQITAGNVLGMVKAIRRTAT